MQEYIQRNIDVELLEWKNNPMRKPLLLRGARQVGKSSAVRHFGKEFKYFAEVNFERHKAVKTFFQGDIDIRLIAQKIAKYINVPIEEGETLLFLDEIQNVDGWEKYARNLADRKYQVYITGSNAKMLSKGIMQELGGRYLPHEVYPYNLREYLNFLGVSCDEKALLQTETRTAFMRAYREYFTWGGLPEAVGMNVKRNYLTSLYQKIYLGDIASRHNISNTKLLQLMLKKIAESTMHPLSYSRIAKILSSVGGKITIPTVSNYISYAEEAWMLLRIRNIISAFADRESNCKYYFIDNGLLSLQLIDADTKLLENMVAIELFRHYGHDEDNERIYFYNDNIEVDFYVPEDELAIQVSYTIKNDETYEREVSALSKLPKVYPCKRRMIITYDEESTLTDEYGVIEVVPCWKWMLQQA